MLTATPSIQQDEDTPSAAARLILLATFALYVAARLWHLAAICMDGDEIFSVSVARLNWHALTVAAEDDSVHPPLFYYLLKLWTGLGGESLLWVRLLPALFSILAVIPLYFLCREFRLRRIETYSVIGLAALHPMLVYYSQHVRMYSLLLLCGVFSLWLFYRAIRTPAVRLGFAALIAANIVLVYSHYYGWLIVGFEICYVILRKRAFWKQSIVSAAAVFLAFCPWLYVAAKHTAAKGGLGSNLGWIQRPSVGDLFWFLVDLSGFGEFPAAGRRVPAWIFVLIAIAVWTQRRHLRGSVLARVLGFAFWFTFCPVMAAFLASRLLPQSIWGHRHMIFVVVPFLLLCATAYTRLPSRLLRFTVAALCVVWAGFVLRHLIHGDDKKTPFDKLAVEILAYEQNSTKSVPFYSVDKYLHYAVGFYLDTIKEGGNTGMAVHLTPQQRAALAKEAALIDIHKGAQIEEAKGPHFWVAYSTAAWRNSQSPETLITQRGCRTGPDFKEGDRFHTIIAFPAWCP